MSPITLDINGSPAQLEAPDDMPLLWALRDLLGLTGTKYGCGAGHCGACTVLLEDSAVRSCQLPVAQAAGKRVTTIEGLSPDGRHRLQRAWIDEQVPQCGYCQSGQIMAAEALLRRTPRPTEDQVKRALNGNLCRCGTYLRIRRAVMRAARDADREG